MQHPQSNIMDQKEVVLHVTVHDQNVLFMFHHQTDVASESKLFFSILKDLKASHQLVV